jgi:hypothetical protein
MMIGETIDGISQAAFEEALEEHLIWAAEWEGALPADVFFGVKADFQFHKGQGLVLSASACSSFVMETRSSRGCHFQTWVTSSCETGTIISHPALLVPSLDERVAACILLS